MNKELNDKDLEKSSGGSLSTVLDIDSIIALGYTRHEYNEDASNCPSYEADEHFKGQAPTCSRCIYSVYGLYTHNAKYMYCMLRMP